jgi:hypothetical protein
MQMREENSWHEANSFFLEVLSEEHLENNEDNDGKYDIAQIYFNHLVV